MTSERWPQIEKILASAIDCDAAGRAIFLDSASGNDPELQREIKSLLAFQEQERFGTASGFVDAIRLLQRGTANRSEGQRIGAYRVLREIGQGGMGNVYLAERADDAFHNLVAIKIIRGCL